MISRNQSSKIFRMKKWQQKYLPLPRESGAANEPISSRRDEAIGRIRKHIKKIGPLCPVWG